MVYKHILVIKADDINEYHRTFRGLKKYLKDNKVKVSFEPVYEPVLD